MEKGGQSLSGERLVPDRGHSAPRAGNLQHDIEKRGQEKEKPGEKKRKFTTERGASLPSYFTPSQEATQKYLLFPREKVRSGREERLPLFGQKAGSRSCTFIKNRPEDAESKPDPVKSLESFEPRG